MNARRNYPLLLTGQFLGAYGDNFLLAAILGPLTFAQSAGQITAQHVSAQNALFSAVFFLPFILLAPVAGFLNDRHPKTTCLAGGNLIKLLGTALGLSGILLHPADAAANLPWQVVGYTIVGIGACVYSPAKYGILPEIVARERLVKANGTVEMLTLVAILTGLGAGAVLYDHFRSLVPCYLASLAWYGLALLFNGLMQRTPQNLAARLRSSARDFGREFWGLVSHVRLGRILLGCGIFWFAGAALRNNLQAWGLVVFREVGVALEDITNANLTLLKVGMAVGIVVGSLLAGKLHRVGDLSWARRYGLALATAVLGLGLLGGTTGLAMVVAVLVAAGLCSGLLLVPLNAALQAETHPGHLGKTIAIQNFVDYCAMLLGAGYLGLLTLAGCGPKGMFLALAGALVVLSFGLRFARSNGRLEVPVAAPADVGATGG
ncbi:MAG: MFS transporter [Verrucomicrobiales bacterium]|nr:MFS transporter [Verrucomicrobiales bacterium]